ncbi:MAG: hypothetical protein LKF96_03720 [Treponema sp.]|nr:hypothetical protein [Treponema sp.]
MKGKIKKTGLRYISFITLVPTLLLASCISTPKAATQQDSEPVTTSEPSAQEPPQPDKTEPVIGTAAGQELQQEQLPQPEAIPESEALIIENSQPGISSQGTAAEAAQQQEEAVSAETVIPETQTQKVPAETTTPSQPAESPAPVSQAEVSPPTAEENVPAAEPEQPPAETPAPDTEAAATGGPVQIESVQEENPVPESSEPEKEEKNAAGESEEPQPSRSITIKRNQYLDVTYPGSGWTYLGETGNVRHMIFFGRKLGSKDTSFTLRSRTAGTTLLHFYKNDLLTGKYIDDYLSVTVEQDAATSDDHATAPSYADIVPPKPVRQVPEAEKETISDSTGMAEKSADSAATPVKSGTANTNTAPDETTGPAKTVIQNTDTAAAETGTGTAGSVPTDTTGTSAETAEQSDADIAGNLLDQATAAYAEHSYSRAYALLNSYMQNAVTRIDEALFLKGQILEAESNIQDIHGAVDAYDEIVKDWPGSAFWEKARQRSIYLKRFYITIH